MNPVYIKPIYLNPQKSNTTTQDMISDQERWDGKGVWVWREKEHVHQEPGKSSSCCWSWFHGEEDVSGLRDSLCRWKSRTRALVELAVWWLTGMNLTQSMSRLQQLVGDPTSESWWTSYSASLWYRSGFMWNSPRMYIWGRLPHLGWNLGVLISECKFRSVIGIHPSNHTRLSFGPSRIIIF